MSEPGVGIRARRLVALAMATLVVAAGAVLGFAAPASAAPADTIYSLVNQARAAQGLRGLIRNPAIDGVAVNWANQMGASGSMTHNPSYSRQIPGGWTGAGENVAMGHPSAEAMFNGWMNSPGHRMLAAVAGAVLIGGALALTLRRTRGAPG
ncbi:MAG TPA: CAP domain-containing protein [Lacisediminihabitans sp.]|nr:CAP domain-containing protein [Lacisediminihabitans sp.]HXD60704.1 CAP domain-containing protein [Lacisediminihabitans sp.]